MSLWGFPVMDDEAAWDLRTFRDSSRPLLSLAGGAGGSIKPLTMLCRATVLPSLCAPGRYWQRFDVVGVHPCMYSEDRYIERLLIIKN